MSGAFKDWLQNPTVDGNGLGVGSQLLGFVHRGRDVGLWLGPKRDATACQPVSQEQQRRSLAHVPTQGNGKVAGDNVRTRPRCYPARQLHQTVLGHADPCVPLIVVAPAVGVGERHANSLATKEVFRRMHKVSLVSHRPSYCDGRSACYSDVRVIAAPPRRPVVQFGTASRPPLRHFLQRVVHIQKPQRLLRQILHCLKSLR